jgi:hypothetical protein
MRAYLDGLANMIRAIAALIAACALVYGVVVLGQVSIKALGIEFAITSGTIDFRRGADFLPDLKDRYQIQFWTPSEKTKETAGIAEWLKVDSDSKLDTFAEELMNGHIFKGYSRFEVVGAGKGVRKKGAWWIASLEDDVKIPQFLNEYKRFWKPGNDSTYMEVMLIKGGYAPKL